MSHVDSFLLISKPDIRGGIQTSMVLLTIQTCSLVCGRYLGSAILDWTNSTYLSVEQRWEA